MKKLKLSQSFTLIELLTVMVIIGIIAGLLAGAGRAARDSAMRVRAKSMISDIEAALRMYYTDIGTYPLGDGWGPPYTTQDLYDKLTNTDYGDDTHASYIVGWNGPYMEFKSEDLGTNDGGFTIIIDPWGRSYNYTFASGVSNPNYPYNVNIWSFGALENPDWWEVYKDLKNW